MAIRFLSIQNLAVVDEVELDLQEGLTVLTGGTSTGKSIVLGRSVYWLGVVLQVTWFARVTIRPACR